MRTRRLTLLLSVAALAAALTQGNVAGRQAPTGPESASGRTGNDYPDGSAWPETAFEAAPPEARVESSALAGAAEMSRGASGLTALPAGLSLGEGVATRVSFEVPAARLTAPDRPIVDPMASGGPEAAPPARTQVEKWFVSFPVSYQGVKLSKFSDVLVVVGGDGKALLTRKRNLPRSVDGTEATVTEAAAKAAAQAHAAGAWGPVATNASSPSKEVFVGPDLAGRVAWVLSVSSGSLASPRSRRYWIAARGEAKVLHFENEIFHDHRGTVSGTLWPTSPLKPTENRVLGDLEVTRTPGGAKAQTNDQGRYSFSGTGAATITATPAGPFSVVQNQAGATLSFSKAGTDAANIDLDANQSGEQALAQISAFQSTNATYRFARDILDPLPAPRPWEMLPTRVNIASSCNAFWNGSSINFYQAGGGCPNTAYSDVVHHEYGHGIDHWRGGILDGGYSEGFGDAVALLITRQSCTGRDFFGAGTCLRDATAVDMWPPPPGTGVHAIGKRYGQFVWALVQQLKKSLSDDEAFRIASRLTLGAAAANPSSIPDAVQLSFVVDDDDGNLANGTPHCQELAAAADSRSIPHPACPKGGRGFAWANNPSAASYTPSTLYSFNSSGGPITVTRSGAGAYAVRFAALGGNGLAGGNVQVTAYGSGADACKVASWASGGADFVVNVRCFSSAGAAADAMYTVLVQWPE